MTYTFTKCTSSLLDLKLGGFGVSQYYNNNTVVSMNQSFLCNHGQDNKVGGICILVVPLKLDVHE